MTEAQEQEFDQKRSVERVALTLRAAVYDDEVQPWEYLGEGIKEVWRERARNAIAQAKFSEESG